MSYLPTILFCIVILYLFKKRFFDTTDYNVLLEDGAIIVDVRSPAEFSAGNIENSLNIPVGELTNKLDYLKNKKQMIIVCCASGVRSGVAKQLLVANSYENVINGGSWSNLKAKINK
ncbi:rhodanese-like domain-containing protein [Flavobacteriales bacterium]|nr:rhodanese-like domain-containing protein [Flavobacteriales bacterium]